MPPLVLIFNHTTASSPRPHILYFVQTTNGANSTVVARRYSEFVALHQALNVKSVELPPKRILTTTFVPSAWLDDELINERKAGLAEYLAKLVHMPEYAKKSALLEFLTIASTSSKEDFDPEDALPSTLTRKAALELRNKLLEDPLPGVPEDPQPIPPVEPVEPVPPAEPNPPTEEPTPPTNPSPPTDPAPPTDPVPPTDPAPPTDPVPPTDPAPPTVPAPPTEPAPPAPTHPEAPLPDLAPSVAAAYYPDWSASSNPPEKLDFSKFDILFYAFATPNSSNKVQFESGSTSILKRLVAAAKNSGKGTKIVLSVGGWAGCYWFSQACSSSANRTTFSNSLVSAVNTYGLAGVDLDWEYPNSPGAGNPYRAADAANFLSLLKLLRSSLGSSKIISSAVAHLPWIGSNGQPLTNVAEYAKQMTYVNIMNYDVWGASSTPGPNAPQSDACKTSRQPKANAQAAFKQWTAAGFPASKLLLGLPLYGYVSKSTKKTLTGSFAPTEDMVILAQEEVTSVDGEEVKIDFVNGAHARPREAPEVTIAANLQSWYNQQIPFKEILKSGALVKKSDGTYGQGGGFTYAWDNCSNTPFLYNVSQKTVVTFDDTWSLEAKAKFAKQNGMAGAFTWSLDQDDGTTLMRAVRKGLGR